MRRAGRGWMLAVIGTWASVAFAQPVLHEYFDVEGHPGPLTSPQPTSAAAWDPELLDPALSAGAVSAPIGVDPGEDYRLDRNTARPDQVVYSDPFTPSIPPFKRLYAYDTVRDDFSLGVADAALQPLARGGTAQPGDDQFFGELAVELQAGVPLRIPSVGPQARIIADQLAPSAPYELLTDSAGNWFIRSPQALTGRLTLHLAIDRRVFGSEYSATATWAALAARLPPLPENLEEQTAAVLSQLQVSQGLAPKQAVVRLIDYFRAFSPSESRPSSSGVQLYQDITLSQLGVCRHRAFAFVVTALSLGVPSRFVRNEAHAWVEVWDGQLWHRVDLGGAAERMAYREPPLVSHVPPRDPYDWPADGEPGTAMVERAAASGGGASAQASEAQTEELDSVEDASNGVLEEQAATPSPAPSSETGGEPQIRFQASVAEVSRGQRFTISGEMLSAGPECGLLRIDVSLMDQRQELIPIGTLATDASGRFEGALMVPTSITVGDYLLVVTSPGNERCGPASSFSDG